MAGIKLVIPETFKSTVNVRTPGGGALPIEFTFKYRTSTALDAFIKGDEWRSVSSAASIQMLASAWDLEDETFGEESLVKLFDMYPAAPAAIVDRYFEELGPKARLGN